jgi:putative phosphoesterase
VLKKPPAGHEILNTRQRKTVAQNSRPASAARRIGLIADTHGLLRPDVHEALAGVELILHAGDVGGDEILDELSIIAPVQAVFGNTDEPGNPRLAASVDIVVGGLRIHVSHGHELGAPNPARLLARYAADVIVYGHTHQPLVTEADGRLVVNPGAAGPARFDLKPSVAILEIRDGTAEVQLVELQ